MVHVVCKLCGDMWEAVDQPRACRNDDCEAGWMDLPCFADLTDAVRVGKEVDAELDAGVGASENWLEAQIDLRQTDQRTRFVKSVLDARDEGFELCCVYCGVGVLAVAGTKFEPVEKHENWCPCAGEDANEEAAANAEP